jgi:hypothetical protein
MTVVLQRFVDGLEDAYNPVALAPVMLPLQAKLMSVTVAANASGAAVRPNATPARNKTDL